MSSYFEIILLFIPLMLIGYFLDKLCLRAEELIDVVKQIKDAIKERD